MTKAEKIAALRSGQTILFESNVLAQGIDGPVKIRAVKGKGAGMLLEPGDLYYGGKLGEELLTVRKVNTRYLWVEPNEEAYYYDTWDCVGVEVVVD